MGLLANVESVSAAIAPATFADVPGLTTGAIAFGGNDKKLIFIANLNLDPVPAGDQGANFRFAVDGVLEGPEVNIFKDAPTRLGSLAGFTWARPGLVGVHTVTLQWELTSGAPATDTARTRNLQVIEVNA